MKLLKITPGSLMTDKRAHYERKKRIMNNLIFHFEDEKRSRNKFVQMSIDKINRKTINLNCTKKWGKAENCKARQTLTLGKNLKTECLNPDEEGKSRLKFWWSLENENQKTLKCQDPNPKVIRILTKTRNGTMKMFQSPLLDRFMT